MISMLNVIAEDNVSRTSLEENVETSFHSHCHPSAMTQGANMSTRCSISILDADRFDVLGDLVTSQPFMREFENISDGWICQDVFGKIAACSMTAPSDLDSLSAHLINWGNINKFEQRLIVLIVRQHVTSTQSYRRLRTINQLLGTYFGRKIRVCLVTKNDLLYIRPDINTKPT
jgi:hypothetical protein